MKNLVSTRLLEVLEQGANKVYIDVTLLATVLNQFDNPVEVAQILYGVLPLYSIDDIKIIEGKVVRDVNPITGSIVYTDEMGSIQETSWYDWHNNAELKGCIH